MKLTDGEFNGVIDFLFYHNVHDLQNNQVLITKEIIEEADEEISEKLLDYSIELTKIAGDHKNDGQLVDYTFTFISPKNKKTKVTTEMCLEVGWNHCEDVEIK